MKKEGSDIMEVHLQEEIPVEVVSELHEMDKEVLISDERMERGPA